MITTRVCLRLFRPRRSAALRSLLSWKHDVVFAVHILHCFACLSSSSALVPGSVASRASRCPSDTRMKALLIGPHPSPRHPNWLGNLLTHAWNAYTDFAHGLLRMRLWHPVWLEYYRTREGRTISFALLLRLKYHIITSVSRLSFNK